MNIDAIKNASLDEIKQNNTLYHNVIEILTYVDHKAPAGACCGKNKDGIINKFINNRDYYVDKAEKTLNRTIKPKWKGPLWFSTAKNIVNADLLTDEDMLYYINNNLIDKKFFDLSNYKEEEIVVEEQPKSKRGRKPKQN